MVGRLILIAHAETAATRLGAFPRGDGLNARGLAAAAAQRGAIPRHDLALASPASAARETAAGLGLNAIVEDALRDLDVGRWAGQSLGEIAAMDEAGAQAFLADPAFKSHGGESIADLVARLGGWLQGRLDRREIAVAVTHPAVIRAALVSVLGAPVHSFWRIDVAPLDVMTLSGDGRRWALRSLTSLAGPSR